MALKETDGHEFNLEGEVAALTVTYTEISHREMRQKGLPKGTITDQVINLYQGEDRDTYSTNELSRAYDMKLLQDTLEGEATRWQKENLTFDEAALELEEIKTKLDERLYD